jgi:acyl-CoA synthetase (AMP-forming)/AMP-acid ligase II
VFVPVNPILKPEQVGHILRDCNARVLITSPERLPLLAETLAHCHDLRQVILTGPLTKPVDLPATGLSQWADLLAAPPRAGHRVIDNDMLAILYTSGSTGRPKGVVLSHRNMVAGAKSVASYLGNNPDDTLLAALPLSFDAGFSQLTTAFHSGARVVLINYLLPQDVLKAVVREKVTGLTAVPPLYIQLAQLNWPETVTEHLRYFANTGGRMPLETLKALRAQLPRTKPFLMYGLTEAFRATYLPPSRPTSAPTPSARRSPTPRCWCSARTAPSAAPTSRANWSSAAPTWRWATGTTPKKPPNASSRSPTAPRAASPAWCCPRSPCSRATPCAATKRATCISSGAATR